MAEMNSDVDEIMDSISWAIEEIENEKQALSELDDEIDRRAAQSAGKAST